MSIFYKVGKVPVHSVLLMPTRDIALNYPKGDIALGFCESCGLVSNVTFDPRLHKYASEYEETQGFSPTFNSFHRRLADYLINRYGLYNKSILEIGCGKGEFLSLLCEMGSNRGFGFDPAYVDERNTSSAKDRMVFIKDFYSEQYSHISADFLCCKMTLEHIYRTREFVSMVHRTIGNGGKTVVFFQVPDVSRILREVAFWDIYYEHCSYFSMGSLTRLFNTCGFTVLDTWKDFDGQYLMIEARAKNRKDMPVPNQADDMQELTWDIAYFSKSYSSRLNAWTRFVGEMAEKGKRTVLWGGGSKGVAFLTTLNIHDKIEYVVDINPYKHGTYMAGTGQQIVGPDFLRAYKPDVVIVMNPVYQEEIGKDLDRMGLSPEIMTV